MFVIREIVEDWAIGPVVAVEGVDEVAQNPNGHVPPMLNSNKMMNPADLR